MEPVSTRQTTSGYCHDGRTTTGQLWQVALLTSESERLLSGSVEHAYELVMVQANLFGSSPSQNHPPNGECWVSDLHFPTRGNFRPKCRDEIRASLALSLAI
jgi:hypothetical protein